jgi:hypothetical protein
LALAVLDVVGVALAVAMGDFFNKINRIMEFIPSRYLSLFFFFGNFGFEMDDCFIAHFFFFWIYLLEAEFNMQVIANLGNEMFGE